MSKNQCKAPILITHIKQVNRSLLKGMVREFKFLKNRKFRFDLCWPELMLAVEVDGGQYSCYGGGAHNKPKDYEKLNLATLEGWRVLRFQTEKLKKDPYTIVKTIEKAIKMER